MGVEKDDFVMGAADLEGLAIVAQADEVFCESAFVFVAAAALHDAVWAESFTG